MEMTFCGGCTSVEGEGRGCPGEFGEGDGGGTNVWVHGREAESGMSGGGSKWVSITGLRSMQ